MAAEGKRRRWPSKREEDLEREVEDMFLECDLEELLAWCNISAPPDPKAMEVAMRVAEEWRLAEWVRLLNEQRGVAPSTAMVLERFEQRRSQLPEGVRPGPRGVAVEDKVRAWALRWRRRWGGRHGSIQAREDIPLEEMRAKAGEFIRGAM